MGWPVEEGWAPPPAEPRKCWDAGLLHVHEQAAGATPRGELTLALLGDLAGLFAILAPHRERQRAQPLLGDLLAALEAVAIGALLQARERVVDLVERLGLH